MATDSPTRRTGTHALRLLRALAEEGKLVFSTAEARDVAPRAGVPQGYVRFLLARMVHNGLLTRLRRGLYAASEIAPGQAGVHPFVIATRLVTPSAISHWSALSYHGLTDQVPRVVTAFTPKKVVTPSMRGSHGKGRRRHAWEVAGIRYEYVSVKSEHFFGIEEIWIDEQSRVPITDRERTVLETFISPGVFGGIGEAFSIAHNHVDNLDASKLVRYARQYGTISVAKRLGWALEQAGTRESILQPLLKMRATRYHALDPSRPRRGPCDKRWMIQDNLPMARGS
jgi:predicted transcriptional regulator of viral defense system